MTTTEWALVAAAGASGVAALCAMVAAFKSLRVAKASQTLAERMFAFEVHPDLFIDDVVVDNETHAPFGHIAIRRLRNQGRGPARDVDVKFKVGMERRNVQLAENFQPIMSVLPGEETLQRCECFLNWLDVPEVSEDERALQMTVTVTCRDAADKDYKYIFALEVASTSTKPVSLKRTEVHGE